MSSNAIFRATDGSISRTPTPIFPNDIQPMKLCRLLLLLVFLCPAMTSMAEARPAAITADRIIAVVNDEVITLNEMRARLAVIERQMRAQNVEMPARDVLERQMLERMIMERVQIQFANN